MQKLGPRVRIVEATPLKPYRMLLKFENGSEREVDLEPYLKGPIFEPVRDDLAFFSDVRIEGGTIAWPNGADIDPDVLYYELKPAWMEKREAA